MNFIIDTTTSEKYLLHSFNEIDAKNINNKGWSFSYVYNFTEIRDVYLALRDHPYKDLPSFTSYCLSIDLPYIKTPWNKRRILEHLNALKNFDLVDNEYKIKKDVFNSSIGSRLTIEDMSVFREIYFSYFRFKEIFLWFINLHKAGDYKLVLKLTDTNIITESKTLFSYSESSRFTDTFFSHLTMTPHIFKIDHRSGEDLMRFWDVFIKWGTVLNVLEKFNLRNIGIKTLSNKNITCTYVIKPLTSFDLLSFIKTKYDNSYIYLPDLVLDLALEFRASIETIKQLVIDEYKRNKEHLSFERTSEIFIKTRDIKDSDKIFFPKHNDSFVSHLIVRR